MARLTITALLFFATTTFDRPIIAIASQAKTQHGNQSIVKSPSNATNLHVTVECSDLEPGVRLTHFSWTVAHGPATKQELVLAPFRESLLHGATHERLETIPLDPKESFTVWRGGRPGVNYYWKVLTFSGQSTASSDISRFRTPLCPVDKAPWYR